MEAILSFRFWIIIIAETVMMVSGRIECDPRLSNTVPHNSPNATLTPGIYYGGNFACRLTCPGNCDSSPAWRPTLQNAFKCQCALDGGCDKNGPITRYEENGDQYPLCTKIPSCNCQFQKKEFPTLKYVCYHCAMHPGNWTIYYACCPKI